MNGSKFQGHLNLYTENLIHPLTTTNYSSILNTLYGHIHNKNCAHICYNFTHTDMDVQAVVTSIPLSVGKLACPIYTLLSMDVDFQLSILSSLYIYKHDCMKIFYYFLFHLRVWSFYYFLALVHLKYLNNATIFSFYDYVFT